MLTWVIEVHIDVIVDWLLTILNESSLSFLLVDFNFLNGCIIITTFIFICIDLG